MDIREELLNNNPFASIAAAEPWVNTAPDFPSLNREVSDQIFYLVKSKALNATVPMGGLVLGEAGSGKTHILRRILDRVKKQDIDAVFVSIKAFATPERVMRDLWREIFVNLTKKHSDKLNQFDFIVGKMMDAYRKDLEQNNLRFDNAKGVQHFQDLLPGIHEDFLKAVFAYYNAEPDDNKKHPTFLNGIKSIFGKKHAENDLGEEKRNVALKWFRGSIDDDHHDLLGVEDRNKMSPGELEQEAQKLILSLGLVLNYCKIPMIVCFDQLDGITDPLLIEKWGRAVSFLVNDTFNILPLAFAKDSIWRRIFVPSLDDSTVQKITGYVFVLKNCTLRQARDLIRIRIASLFLEGVENKTEWVLKQLGEKLDGDFSPRMILELANHVVAHPGEKFPSAVDVLEKTYQEEYDKVAADFDSWPPDTEHLLHAFEPYLIHNANFKNIQRPKGHHKYIFLVGQRPGEDGNGCPYAFIVNTEENHKTVSAAFRQGVDFLNKHPNGVCYYITDERCLFRGPDRWKQVHEEWRKFKELKGIAIFLDRARAIDWYALTALRFKLDNGDITLMTPYGEQRTAVFGDFTLYLKDGFKRNLLEEPETEPNWPSNSNNGNKKPSKTKIAATPPSPPEDLEKRVREILCGSPMHLMKVALLFGQLHKDKVSITYDLLLEFLRERNNVFTLFLSGDSIVQLVG
jgi:hypothetical protein